MFRFSAEKATQIILVVFKGCVHRSQPQHVQALADTYRQRGYEVRELPIVVGGEDDGDSDFQEHIDAIEKAIEAFKAEGYVELFKEIRMIEGW